MEEAKRILLKRGKTLHLALEPDGSGKQAFIIQSVIGEGSASVCYDAIRVRDGQPGKLKEFYPLEAAAEDWYYSLARDPDGQLIPRGSTLRKFTEMCEDYLDTHRLLNKVMVENPKNQVLKNYIQNGEILYGIAGENGMATVYTWSTGVMGQGFDAYLAEVRKDPGQNADRSLYEILNTVYTLTDCIRAMHTAGLMHLDIKPSNFLVPYNSREGLNSSSVSLFDINTLYSVYSDIPRMAGTEGFRAPEVFRRRADNRSDIYSIGAMLFNALVITDDIPDGLYRESCYGDLDRLVKQSKLLQNTVAGTKQVAKLANILKKCLARHPAERYDSCSSLMEDLRKVCFEAKKNAVEPQLIGQNKKLEIVQINEKSINSPDIVLQKMLYEHPLYEALEPGETEINVLVVGSGTYGQKFMDHCLQAGQMKGHTVSITAVSNTPQEDLESYLQFRPALGRFVNINGSLEQVSAGGQRTVDSRAYGDLRFLSLNRACGREEAPTLSFEFAGHAAAQNKNKQIVGDMVACAVKNGKVYDYIFVALGNTRINREIAGLYEAATAGWGRSAQCPVCYIHAHKKKAARRPGSKLYPVYVGQPITPESIDPHLEQMAFNTHIAYRDSLNMDIRREYADFRKNAYHYEASLAYALSIPYKLFSIGVVLQNREQTLTQTQFPGKVILSDALAAAQYFDETVLKAMETEPEAREKYNTLVCLEHQRWVLSKVTNGWDAPRNARGQLDLEQCVSSGTIQNKRKCTHPCLVFSTEKTPLSSPEYSRDSHAKWEDPQIDPQLDDLDRMSVELHQRFRARAEAFKAENPLRSEYMQDIEMLLLSAPGPVLQAFRQLQFCLKNILQGVESYTVQYDHYEQGFTDALKCLPGALQERLRDRLGLLRKAYFPVIQANLYRNYKASDEILVKKLPFILTYRFQGSLALAFADGKAERGKPEAIFTNVASATVLSPEKLHYLYDCHEDTSPELLAGQLGAVLNYLGGRGIGCTVSLVVTFPKNLGKYRRERLKNALEVLKPKDSQREDSKFWNYEILDYAGNQEAVRLVTAWLRKNQVAIYDGSTDLFASASEQTAYLVALEKCGVPYFEFDWKNKRFTQHRSCGYLHYIPDRSCIRVQDMLALANAEELPFHLPEFSEDHMALWDIYTGGDINGARFSESVDDWNMLCDLLKAYEKQQAPLVTFYPLEGDAECRQLEYLLPEYCFRTVKQLIKQLTGLGVIDPASGVSNYTSENCRVRLVTSAAYEFAFDGLFSRPERLLPFYGMEAVQAADGTRVRYQNMTVTGLDLDARAQGCHERLLPLLQKLRRQHFISGLTEELGQPQLVSFTYSSQRIKGLLTSSGEILKVHTYYQLLHTGYFDDVVCDCELEDRDGKAAIDIVATKGFRSLLITCGAGHGSKRDHSLADQFGIGATRVQVGRGAAYTESDVITVQSAERIMHIGNTLMEIMENYV